MYNIYFEGKFIGKIVWRKKKLKYLFSIRMNNKKKNLFSPAVTKRCTEERDDRTYTTSANINDIYKFGDCVLCMCISEISLVLCIRDNAVVTFMTVQPIKLAIFEIERCILHLKTRLTRSLLFVVRKLSKCGRKQHICTLRDVYAALFMFMFQIYMR